MSTRKINNGNTIKHTPTAAVSAGGVVVLVDLIGIAPEDIPADVEGTLEVEGKFELAKQAATAMPAGTIVYWDEADQEVQTTADGGANKQIGKVAEAAASADTVVSVKLTP